VAVVYTGRVPFDGLGGSENVTGFLDSTNMIMNNGLTTMKAIPVATFQRHTNSLITYCYLKQ